MLSRLKPRRDPMLESLENPDYVEKGYVPTIDDKAAERLGNIYGRYETTLENRLYKAFREFERVQGIKKVNSTHQMGLFGKIA